MTATMSVYTIPTTGEQILADTLANATVGFPELHDQITAGAPLVRVEATSDGYGNARATILAGVRLPSGEFIPAHLTGTEADDHRFAPQVKFRTKDGRLDAAQNARKALTRFFALTPDVPVEWVSYGY